MLRGAASGMVIVPRADGATECCSGKTLFCGSVGLSELVQLKIGGSIREYGVQDVNFNVPV